MTKHRSVSGSQQPSRRHSPSTVNGGTKTHTKKKTSPNGLSGSKTPRKSTTTVNELKGRKSQATIGGVKRTKSQLGKDLQKSGKYGNRARDQYDESPRPLARKASSHQSIAERQRRKSKTTGGGHSRKHRDEDDYFEDTDAYDNAAYEADKRSEMLQRERERGGGGFYTKKLQSSRR
ncbi:unnamed protein product [Didymodactylos carnosus]|uniref:Uncharacterized protein n=1 Tax=Didymodactylos carnosus TaxID=1234261 RepID=A0A815HPS2_9BILA|nr:unnamed protein product [Didymodactylos carnosus]CAF1354576.1 unnamed protein product [Didymodactylos carnosus]CAF4005691.1 unnamed protein product [Didymodactylos carnosus]CAF4227422.1 unnamed protein product [Didymodactylos carnosus]